MARSADDLTQHETAYAHELLRSDAIIAITCDVVQTFFAPLQNRRGGKPDAWLERADTCGVRELAAFAAGILRDYQVVRTAFELSWSQGQTETADVWARQAGSASSASARSIRCSTG